MDIETLHNLFISFAQKVKHQHAFEDDKCVYCHKSVKEQQKERDQCAHHWVHDYHGMGGDGYLCHDCGATKWECDSDDD